MRFYFGAVTLEQPSYTGIKLVTTPCAGFYISDKKAEEEFLKVARERIPDGTNHQVCFASISIDEYRKHGINIRKSERAKNRKTN